MDLGTQADVHAELELAARLVEVDRIDAEDELPHADPAEALRRAEVLQAERRKIKRIANQEG